ncbi:MAG: hypothetical protein KatS3mg068_1378 [Candidatus Sericytochromatia bacterium]|nr:MAG: hypothetical protein KatS3mg068_1378 [Candidatus Sericytochromatia bacterium]
MKSLLKKVVSLGIVSSILLTTSCSLSNSTQVLENSQNINVNSTSLNKDAFKAKTVKVSVEKANIYGDQVEISSSFDNFKVSTSEISKTTRNITINSESPQLITLFDEKGASQAKAPLALSIVANPQKAQTVLISPQSTAEALIFMNPALASDDVKMADKIMNIIKSIPETKELAKLLETRVQQNPDYLYIENTQQNNLISKAVNTVVNKLADEYESKVLKAEEPSNRVQGVEIKVTDKQDLIATFEFKNYKKRNVDLYFEGNGRPIYKESLFAAWDLIDLDNLALGYRPFTKVGTFDIQRPMDKVEVIGMGLKDMKEFKEKWPSMSNQEKMKYGLPIAQGVMSGFISPVISIIVGFNVNKVWNANLMRLVTNMPILEIVNLFKNKEYGKAFKLMLSSTIKNLLDRNGALLRELLLAIGVNLTDAILKRMNAIIGIFNLTRYAVEAIRALYAYATTNIIDYFKVDNSNGNLIFTRYNSKN